MTDALLVVEQVSGTGDLVQLSSTGVWYKCLLQVFVVHYVGLTDLPLELGFPPSKKHTRSLADAAPMVSHSSHDVRDTTDQGLQVDHCYF